MMTKSAKYGTLVLQVFIFPGKQHTSQGTQKLTGSCFMSSYSSKGFTKFSLLPTAYSYLLCSCFSYYSAFSMLQPIFCNYQIVLRKQPISMFLSILGAKGFLMFEFPLGSLILIVSGKCLPSRYALTLSRNKAIFQCYSGEVFALSSWPFDKSSKVLLNKASALVTSAFLEGISRSSSSRKRVEYSERMISLSRSSLCRHLKRIQTPRSGSFPANCTSLLVSPQCSQRKEHKSISRKRGMSTSRMVVTPVSWQRGHSVSA